MKMAKNKDMQRDNKKCKYDREDKGVNLRIGTWNIRSLNDKEEELIEEFERSKLDILAITETKKKGNGIIELERGHILMYSGVNQETRAAEGVGCIIKEELRKSILNWEFITGKLLKVELQIDKQNKITLVIVYGPGEDEIARKKDEFWEQISEITESINGRVLLLGDFNGRVGKRNNDPIDVIGNQGEIHRNNNGERLISFCVNNNLIVTNTFYKHKDIHKFTREVKSRNEKSIIDYFLVNRTYRNEIRDVKVRRGPEIYSDHYLVVAKVRLGIESQENHKRIYHKKVNETIKTYKLQETEIANKFSDDIQSKIEREIGHWETMNLEQLWQYFKEIVLTSAKEACGTTTRNINKKQTRWWNQEIKEEVKSKKEKWKFYLNHKTEESYATYKQQRTKVKEMILQAKQLTWEEFGRKLEADSLVNQKLFYKVLKNLRKDKHCTLRQVRAKDGSIIIEENEIIERWKDYFRELLNPDEHDNKTDDEEIKYTDEEEEGNNIRIEEVITAVNYLKKGKAAGHDKINAEMLKNLGRRGIELLTKIFNKAWDTAKVPEDWKIGIILPIFKKGDSRECSNYRGITLLSVVSKVYEHILEKRLRSVTEEQLEDAQSGFRKGRSVQDHIFSIKQMIEKNRIKNSEIYMAFLDIEKAFDRVLQKAIWKNLTQRNVSPKLIKGIQSLYNNNKSYIRKDNLQSTAFGITEGLRQGGVMSPTLFILIMDDIIKTTANKTKKVHIGFNKLSPVNVSVCAFADDLMICAAKEKDLQENLQIWEEELAKRNLKINISKTKVMVISKENKNTNIEINQSKIEQVDVFKYLGVQIDREGNMESEVNERIGNAARLYHSLSKPFISKKEINRKTKMVVYKTIFRPILTYGSESWVLTNSMKSKIQAIDMKYLRRVKGITRRDRIRNDSVREELEIEPIHNAIEKQKLKWFGHICRMSDNRQVKRIWEAGVHRHKSRGRPKKTWNDEVAAILKKKGRTWAEAKKLATNKKEWTKFVHIIN